MIFRQNMNSIRDVDGFSRPRDIPRLSRDQKLPGVRIPGFLLLKNPGIQNPGIKHEKKSRDFPICLGISRRDFFPLFSPFSQNLPRQFG